MYAHRRITRVAAAILTVLLGAWALTSVGAKTAAAASSPTDNQVVNPSGTSNSSGWKAVTQAGKAAVTAVAANNPAASTAIQVTTTASTTAAYKYVLVSLSSPGTFFVVGQKYEADVWYRDVTGTGGGLDLLVANGGYEHRPTTSSRTVTNADTGWHEAQLAFTATATGYSDTALYLALPAKAEITYQFAGGSMALVPARPAVPASESAAPNTATAPQVANPSGASGTSGWGAHVGTGGTATVLAVSVTSPVATTAVQVQTSGLAGTAWQYTQASLVSPATSFVIGKTYRMEIWYRAVSGAGGLVMRLANGNATDSPSLVAETVSYTDTAWHHVQRTFIATSAGYSDTALYLGLPSGVNLTYQFAGAAVTAVGGDAPATVANTPTATIPFSGAKGSLPSGVWNVRTGGGGWGNNEVETYTARTSNAQVDGSGDLTITTRKETYKGSDGITRDYTSARVDTGSNVAIQPGSYVEATISAPATSGAWPAFWMLGTSIFQVGWPASGELDMFEGAGASTNTAHAAVHMASTASSTLPTQYAWGEAGGTNALSSAVSSPHTYGVYFDKNTVRFYIDHKATMSVWASDAAVSGRAWPFSSTMGLVLNSAVTSVSAAATGTWPQTMTVSPVRVYSGGVPF